MSGCTKQNARNRVSPNNSWCRARKLESARQSRSCLCQRGGQPNPPCKMRMRFLLWFRVCSGRRRFEPVRCQRTRGRALWKHCCFVVASGGQTRNRALSSVVSRDHPGRSSKLSAGARLQSCVATALLSLPIWRPLGRAILSEQLQGVSPTSLLYVYSAQVGAASNLMSTRRRDFSG